MKKLLVISCVLLSVILYTSVAFTIIKASGIIKRGTRKRLLSQPNITALQYRCEV